MTETMMIEVTPPDGGGARNSGTFGAMALLVRRRLIHAFRGLRGVLSDLDDRSAGGIFRSAAS